MSSMQGVKDSCVFSSDVSGVRFAGFEAAAIAIGARLGASLKHPIPMKLLEDAVKSKAVPEKTVMKVYKRGMLDLLAYDNSPHPTTV